MRAGIDPTISAGTLSGLQDMTGFQLLRPVYRRWLTIEILSGRIDAPLDESTLRHRWIAPRQEYLDPLKGFRKRRDHAGNGLTSRREACAELGISVEDLDKQISSDRAREKTLGLDFGSSKKRPALRRKEIKMTSTLEMIPPISPIERKRSLARGLMTKTSGPSRSSSPPARTLIGGTHAALIPSGIDLNQDWKPLIGAPVVNAHQRSDIKNILGSVIDVRVVGSEVRATYQDEQEPGRRSGSPSGA